ncbi:hypothetical protein V8017_02915 [Stenotrophomonas rhizophila]
MNPRQDLLELTPAALMALANPGFVKRAQKDLAAGVAPALDIDASGTVTATYDDGCIARLPVGCTLRDAQCSCTASAMCRHRVTLVLARQARAAAAAPSPANHADAAVPVGAPAASSEPGPVRPAGAGRRAASRGHGPGRAAPSGRPGDHRASVGRRGQPAQCAAADVQRALLRPRLHRTRAL